MKKNTDHDYRILIKRQPPIIPGGEPILVLNRRMFETQHEFAIGARLVMHRELFGRCYQTLRADYFNSMPRNSGAMVSIFLPMRSLLPSVIFPGDIDLLIIPYEKNHLVLSQAMALELKVVRAKFSKQGKSPNEFGFSQAEALLRLGFPYVGIAHLIVSDQSPPEYHQKMSVAQIVDEIEGRAEFIGETMADMMPMSLMERSFGRLMANCKNPHMGLLASYIGGQGCWFPEGRGASKNPKANNEFLDLLGKFYRSNVNRFINIPRYPRPEALTNQVAGFNPRAIAREVQEAHGSSGLPATPLYRLSLLHEEMSSIFLVTRASSTD